MRHQTGGSAGVRRLLPEAAPDRVEPLDAGRAWLEQIIATQRAIAEAGLDFDAIAQVVCDQARALTGAEGAAVMLAEGDSLRCAAASGFVAESRDSRLSLDETASGWAFRHNATLRIDDSETDPHVDPDVPRRLGIASGVVVPLHHGDVSVGVVVVHSPRRSAFSEDDERRLDLLSILLSAAMSNAAAFEAKRAQVETLGRFRKIFDGAPIGLIRLNDKGQVVEANAAMERMLGYSSEELGQLTVADITDPRDLQRCVDLYGEIVADKRDSYVVEKRYVRKDGRLIWAIARATVLERDEERKPIFAIMMIEDITERKLAELALKEHDELSQAVDSLTKFQTIVDGLPTGLVRLDRNKRVVEMNAAFEQMVGYTVGELATLGFACVLDPDEADSVRLRFAELYEGKLDSYKAERRYIRKDGEAIWCHVSVVALERDDDGRARFVIVMAEDITQRKLAELALHEKTEQLARIVETQRDVAAADLDLESVMTLICERTQELTGGDGASILMVEDDGFVYRAASGVLAQHVGLRAAFEGTFPGWVRSHGHSAIGHDSLTDERFSPRAPRIGIRSAVGVLLRHGETDVGQLHVTSQCPHAFDEGTVQTLDLLSVLLSAAMSHASEFEAVQRVKENAERLARIVETQRAVAAADLDLESVMTLICERTQELTGGDGAGILVVEDDAFVNRAASGVLANQVGIRWQLESSFPGWIHASGSPGISGDCRTDPRFSKRAVELGIRSTVAIPLGQSDGSISQLHVVSRNTNTFSDGDVQTLELLAVVLSAAISHAAEFEAKRQQVAALSQLEVVWRNSPIGIQVVTFEGHVVSANPAMLAIYGCCSEELAARHMSEYVHPDDIDPIVSSIQKLKAGEYEGDTCKMEARFIRSDGSLVSTMSLVSLVRDPNGVPLFFVGMVEDVTGQHEAEEQLRQSQKIEAIGQLSAGIAHDFNNLLMGVLGYAGLARGEVEEGTQLAEYLKRIEETGHRAASLTKQLLAFGRRQTLQPCELDLNELIVDTLSMLGRLLGEQIEIASTLHPHLPPLRADPTQIQQVLLNLALNARDAMPDGGVLTIETWMTSIGENAGSRLELAPGRYVVLSVGDTGGGMAPAVVERIFEPFFTTKGVGEGSGLGLPSVYGIVKQSRGDLELESELGAGTTFRIYLPALEVSGRVQPTESLSTAQ